IQALCFVQQSGSQRRTAVDIQSMTTQTGCSLFCRSNIKCDAFIFNSTDSRCILLSVPLTPLTNECPVAFKSYVRTTTNCPDLPPTEVDLDYTPGPCSTLNDIAGPPVALAAPVCGKLTTGNRKIVFDAILHDGTHMILENRIESFVQWDAENGSWYFELGKNLKYYFKCGTCVRPPPTR
ncbi:hypothetical protein PFISCL1PPCAC_1511, partial [Pristionchus fissidentatus]